MTQKFTAEEVRKEADFLSTYSRKPAEMLTAYADTLSKPADSGRVDAKEYLDNCVNALDHIARTARNCRVTSKRLTWIASRAESAINSDDAWRDAPVPQNGASALMRARVRIKELEAALAAQLEQITDGKAQWDEVANILGADGDNVDDVIAKARVLAAQGQGEVACHRFVGPTGEAVTEWDDGLPDNGKRFPDLCPPVSSVQYAYFHPTPPASPAGVPDGMVLVPRWIIGNTLRAIRDVDTQFRATGQPSGRFEQLANLLAPLAAAPSAPEGDGGGE